MIVRNEENFAEKSSYSFTYAKVLLISFIILLAIFIGSFFLVESLLAQWFDPRHAERESRRQLLELYAKVDSLEQSVMAKQMFIQRIQYVLNGDTTQTMEDFSTQVRNDKDAEAEQIDLEKIAPIDSQFRAEFEGLNLSHVSVQNSELPFLFPPIDGFVSQSFNIRSEHLGVDVVSKPNEPVKNVADGTVIFADWTREFGFVLAIQHSGNLTSVYKHNAKLLKKVGNFVSEGEIISIIGNSGELTDGPHLHFELWHQGNPLNPEEFVLF